MAAPAEATVICRSHDARMCAACCWTAVSGGSLPDDPFPDALCPDAVCPDALRPDAPSPGAWRPEAPSPGDLRPDALERAAPFRDVSPSAASSLGTITDAS